MNYIWELAIKAIQKGIDESDIFYTIGQPFSAYMELSMECMNETDIPQNVEINPFYRYFDIFKQLFEPNLNENQETIEVCHDLAIHHLKDIDVLMGMNKREYYIHFVIRDLEKGYFGEYVKQKINVFTPDEKKTLANNLLRLYETGEGIYLLRDTVRRIFTSTYIFSNAEEKDEIIFYLRTKQTEQKEQKLEVIKYLFLPFKCTVEVYWENIFGVIGIDDLMKIEHIMNY